jgi:hypothetical protein
MSDYGIQIDEYNSHDNYFSLLNFFKPTLIIFSYSKLSNTRISKLVNDKNVSIIYWDIILGSRNVISLILS